MPKDTFPAKGMARRCSPLRPTAPVLTVEQKRYRIERFLICIKRLEDFDPEKVRRRVGVPEVVTLEAGIDNALAATFGYGTASYFRFNFAAMLDVGLTNAAADNTFLRSAEDVPGRGELAAQEARKCFRDGKARSIALLREAICMLEAEVADARGAVGAAQRSDASETAAERTALRQGIRNGSVFKTAWRRVGQWWRGSAR